MGFWWFARVDWGPWRPLFDVLGSAFRRLTLCSPWPSRGSGESAVPPNGVQARQIEVPRVLPRPPAFASLGLSPAPPAGCVQAGLQQLHA